MGSADMSVRQRSALVAMAAVLMVGSFMAVTVASTASDPQRSAKEADVPPGREARELILPFDAYGLSVFQIHTVEYAQDLLIRDCMRAQGLSWNLLPPPAEAAAEPPNRRRYGVLEAEVAARYGYHLPPPAQAMNRREAVWKERRGLPSYVRRAAYGEEGGGGCWKKAQESLLQGAEFDTSRYNAYVSEAFDEALDDPEVTAATRKWSACMRARGFEQADPLSVTGDPSWRKSSRPSPQEIATARADVRCKESTGLISVWRQVDTRIQRKIIRSHEKDFRAFAESKARWLEAARQAVRDDRS
ncbi:hypothetical protein AB0F77_38800 [Streptomyces sp. NPDC026672]|uniref:hypothetical protein n=1 Tax=unclassified Streptomyces TaxID=2593676 RepID=UPI0033F240A1